MQHYLPSYLDGGVASFQKRNGQENALMEHSVTGCVHYEVDDQIGGSLLVEVTLNLSQAHLTPARGAGSRPSPWKDRTLLLLRTQGTTGIFAYSLITDLEAVKEAPNSHIISFNPLSKLIITERYRRLSLDLQVAKMVLNSSR